MTAEAIWEKSLGTLKGSMTSVSYDTWIAPLVPVCVNGSTLVLMAENNAVKNTLSKLYSESVARAASSASGEELTVDFIEPSALSSYRDEKEPQPARTSMLNPRYTFDNFVIGSSNNFAHAAAMAVADSPAAAYNPLFVYGGVGLGKTHLMHAIGNKIIENDPRARVIYVTSETFTNELIQSIQENKSLQFRSKYRSADVLMIDDVQFISGKVSTQEEFFNTFNALHTSGRQIIISSDRPPMELTTLEERLRSRFEGGLIADIQSPDLETRTAILRKKAELEGFDISDNVLSFIAEKVASNIRQLEGSLIRVMAYSKINPRLPLDINLADAALKDIIPGFDRGKITIDLIQQIVADYYSVDVDGLLSQRRTMEITYPRQVAMYLCKELTDTSLKNIGRSFGGRDHTTVINACRKIEADISSDADAALAVDNLIKRIKKVN